MESKIPLIIDCDCTLGIPGCDVDDGTAILYMLGCSEVKIEGITCSYGNSTQDNVYNNVKRLLKKWRCEEIPVLEGSPSPAGRISPAAHFLADMSEKYKGSLRVLCLGSTTNLAGAGDINPDFYQNVKAFSFMGGLTEPLFVGGKPMGELNFSIDYASTVDIFSQAHDIYIASAGNCLKSYFSEAQFHAVTEANPCAMSDFLREEIQYWYDYNRKYWNLEGFINWDVMAAAQLVHPEYFNIKETTITPTHESMKNGSLKGGGPEIKCFLPEITDPAAYTEHVYQIYFNAKILEEKK